MVESACSLTSVETLSSATRPTNSGSSFSPSPPCYWSSSGISTPRYYHFLLEPDFKHDDEALLLSGAWVHAEVLSTGKDELHREIPKERAHPQADDGLGRPLVPLRHRRHLPPGALHPLPGAVEQWNSFLDLEREGLRGKWRFPHLDPVRTLRSHWRGLRKLIKHWLLCSQTLCPCAKKTFFGASQANMCSRICWGAQRTQ